MTISATIFAFLAAIGAKKNDLIPLAPENDECARLRKQLEMANLALADAHLGLAMREQLNEALARENAQLRGAGGAGGGGGRAMVIDTFRHYSPEICNCVPSRAQMMEAERARYSGRSR